MHEKNLTEVKTYGTLLNAVMGIAAVGFIASALVHVGTYLNLSIFVPFISLHLGVFVVWIPAMFVANKMGATDRSDYWRVALRGAPPWMRTGVQVLIGYAVLNFLASLAIGSNFVRAFSGHWMVFYAAAFATLYSALHTDVWQRRCALDHKVPFDAEYCPTCGSRIPD